MYNIGEGRLYIAIYMRGTTSAMSNPDAGRLCVACTASVLKSRNLRDVLRPKLIHGIYRRGSKGVHAMYKLGDVQA